MKIIIRQHAAIATMPLLFLTGCANLPASGPTAGEIYAAKARSDDDSAGFQIVELTSMASLPDRKDVEGEPVPPFFPGRQQPTNLVGPGDVLDVSVYEAGVTLFADPVAQLGTGTATGARSRELNAVRVDDDGTISLPYLGRIQVTGHTTTELQRMIEGAMRGQSERPQVMVSLRTTVTNSVIVYGEVGKAGREVLATNHETLLDVIAAAGGYRGEATSLVVRLERDGQVFRARLDEVQRSSAGNITVYPGDRISLLREPLTYSVMGAVGRVTQVSFPKSSTSLAEALAQSGGPDDNRGDPKAVFVFRMIRDANGEERPTVYHLNMMKPQSYFISQRFAMRDQDVLYVGNASTNRTAKTIGIIGQIFGPIVAARAVAN